MKCSVHGPHGGICHDCARERGRKMNHAEWRAAELEAILRVLLDLHDPPSAAIRRRHAEDERGWNMILAGAVRRGRVLVPMPPECEACVGKGVHRGDDGDDAPCRACDGEGCHRDVERVSDVERALWAEIGRKVNRLTEPATTVGAYVDRCVAHAITALAPYFPGQDLTDRECEVNLFKQSWPNTACGWPGIAGQAFTAAYTVVVVGPHGDAVVYFGRPAYYLPVGDDVPVAQREKFHEALRAARMPAVRDCASVGCRRFS